VDELAIREVEERWAPSDHKVFQLVPPHFGRLSAHLWEGLGCPIVSADSLWIVFSQLVDAFRGVAPDPHLELALQDTPGSGYDGGPMDSITLIPDLNPAELHAGVSVAVPSVMTIIKATSEPQVNTAEAGVGPSVSDEESASEQGEWGDDDDRIFVTFSDEDEEITEEKSGSESNGEDEIEMLL
jgi:hypothetical protein